KMYRIIEITKGPALAKAGAYTDATVKFKVEKAWLAENSMAKEAVTLHHYEGGMWNERSTTVGEDDGTYVHYSAKTPSFSYFVIGQKSGAVAAPQAEAAPSAPAAEAAEAPAGEAAMEQKGMSKGWLLALLAAVVVVVAVVLYMKKKK
ncbi:MAG: PGF-pre-PGF domain-containing protein, partial [Nanoarchaeota archaeon]|nr:PGF-pre-PGF domain-containing protein [Nanoarchaeota archaeon]